VVSRTTPKHLGTSRNENMPLEDYRGDGAIRCRWDRGRIEGAVSAADPVPVLNGPFYSFSLGE
jgi:hypothetical protein